jgi:hypothetical protein
MKMFHLPPLQNPLSRHGRFILLVFLAITGVMFRPALTQGAGPDPWDAEWIAAPHGPVRDMQVVYFRKAVVLERVPDRLVVHVSADNRFVLRVNGARVGEGPARGDLRHWRYETFELAKFLRPGRNLIAAVVWNYGTLAPLAQMSFRTGFLLSAERAEDAFLNTGATWQAKRELGRGVIVGPGFSEYYAAGPPEEIDGRKVDWHWDDLNDQNSAGWSPAIPLGRAAPREARDAPTPWALVSDALPPMEYSESPVGRIVRVTGLAGTNTTLSLDQPIVIPPRTEAIILIDRGTLTTAYPRLQLKGGRDASVATTYAEALYDHHRQKGNRNEVAGREMLGLRDRLIADGAPRTYEPLWWRTWRYLELHIKTAGEPLTIESLRAYYSAYPFRAQARFESDDPELARIWAVGWRTAQLCAHETYMDTPYWEQLQYVGDTRIQALISYGVAGDDGLARQALEAFHDSLVPEGLTQSRYPSALTQMIPPFSLLWVGMLHDYWEYRDDPDWVRSLLPGTRGVLDWFSARQRADGLLGLITWWPFVDWSPPDFQDGVPPQEIDGGAAALTLQFIEALNYAADLEERFGEKERAAAYRVQAQRAAAGLMRLNWDAQTGLLADTPAKKHFSQQANALAVWLDVIPRPEQELVMRKVLVAKPTEPSTLDGKTVPPMAQATYYFRFYVAQAMVHAGLGDLYVAQLDPWRKMLALGLSTWAETPEPTRSDSHAWSAHPTFDLLTIVAGIAPAEAGFKSVEITPHLGPLRQVSASMPSPRGLIQVSYDRNPQGWNARLELPEGLSGTLRWQGRSVPLHPGVQVLTLER